MPITVVFDPPVPSDSPSTFNTKAFATLGDLNDWSTQANALPGEVASDLSALLAAPPAIGSTTPSSGKFTTVTTSGNVGIGSSNPTEKLEVVNAGAVTAKIWSATNTTPIASLELQRGTNATWGADAYGDWRLRNDSGNLLFQSGESSVTTERMRIDSAGNVGIGVAPSGWNSYKVMQIGQGAFINDNASSTEVLSSAYYSTGFKYLNSSYAPTRYAGSNGAHYWYTAPSGTAGNPISFTAAMTLDASGNLLVGTTSAGSSVATGGFQVLTNGFGAGSSVVDVGHTSGTASGTAYERYFYNGSVIGHITQSGTTAVLYNTTSDRRLKENITDAPAASDLIDAIQVRSFDWKSDGSHQRYGMVAQELYEVAPEAVHAPADPDEMMAVDYSKLVPMLVKEIQSLRQRVAQLEG